jgi:hypothetical protein
MLLSADCDNFLLLSQRGIIVGGNGPWAWKGNKIRPQGYGAGFKTVCLRWEPIFGGIRI